MRDGVYPYFGYLSQGRERFMELLKETYSRVVPSAKPVVVQATTIGDDGATRPIPNVHKVIDGSMAPFCIKFGKEGNLETAIIHFFVGSLHSELIDGVRNGLVGIGLEEREELTDLLK